MENLEQKIVEAVHILPDDKKAKVLEFAENLKEEKSNGAKSEKDRKNDEEAQKARLKRLMKLSGMGNSGHSDTSQRVDEILAEGANKREGWSLP
ncbi:MAG: hypothetical protein ACR2J3_13470 [Aridibacter sp.]